jgi:hypothetical protein
LIFTGIILQIKNLFTEDPSMASFTHSRKHILYLTRLKQLPRLKDLKHLTRLTYLTRLNHLKGAFQNFDNNLIRNPNIQLQDLSVQINQIGQIDQINQ